MNWPIKDFVKISAAHRVSSGVTYAAFTALVWDILLTYADEVTFVWPAKLTIIKGLFLFNRYVSPTVVGVNMWLFSGHARNISDQVIVCPTCGSLVFLVTNRLLTTSCRVWLSIAIILQMLGLSIVSLVVAIRLHAFYEISRRTFLFVLFIWFASLAAQFGLMGRNYLSVMHTIKFLKPVNMCIVALHNGWQNWLPYTLEHGIFSVLLFAKAFKTPRSSQTPLLAIMYKQGILYFAITFILFFTSFAIWRYLPLEWALLPFFTTWLLCQITMSRLLLSVKSSQAFEQTIHLRSEPAGSQRAIGRSLSPRLLPPGFSAATLSNQATYAKHDAARKEGRVERRIMKGSEEAEQRNSVPIPLTSILRASISAASRVEICGSELGEADPHRHHHRDDSNTQSELHQVQGGHHVFDKDETDKGSIPSNLVNTTFPPYRVTPAAAAAAAVAPGRNDDGRGLFSKFAGFFVASLPWWLTRRSLGELHVEVEASHDDDNDDDEHGTRVDEENPNRSPKPTTSLGVAEEHAAFIGAGASVWTQTRNGTKPIRGGRSGGGLRVSRLGRYDQWL